MSKYNRGGRDEGRDPFGSRQKPSYEPVLGSSVNPGPSEDCQNSHEAHNEEKDPFRSQDFRGGADPRHPKNDPDGHPGHLHHREDEQRPHFGGQLRGSAESNNVKSADKRRSQSPESRNRHPLGHDGGRGGVGRNHETNNRDRRSPDKRRERRTSRSRSRDRRRSKSRSRERYRSRSRDRERRRARSRSRDRRKSKSKERKFRRSRSRDRARHRSHSRSRSRTPSRPRHVGPAVGKPTTKADDGKAEMQKKLIEMSNEKPSNLPLNDLSQPSRLGLMTPQMAVQQAMAAMNARAQQLTGVTLPKYYNPAAVNPLKYAEQMQKRKLLWQSTPKKEVPAPSTNNWECTTFAQDQDGRVAAKFKKLMGIKGAEEAALPPSSEEQLRKQEELFRTLDHQYETARMSTHSYRGVGLGFSSAAVAAANAAPTSILFPK